MCFDTSDTDWIATINEVTDGTPDAEACCLECGATIGAGEWRRHIFQQECEGCRRCEWEELDEDEEPCVEHDYGETFSGDICETCVKILDAIKAVELDAGCAEWESQPLYGELSQEMMNEKLYDPQWRYHTRVREMFPGLESPLLVDGEDD